MLSRHVGAAIAATATTVLLATGAAADAATRTVHAGAPAAQAAALPEGAIGNGFYPRRTTLKAGDKVAFKVGGLHNIRRAYAHAISQRYRFYSYGDAMLIDRERAAS